MDNQEKMQTDAATAENNVTAEKGHENAPAAENVPPQANTPTPQNPFAGLPPQPQYPQPPVPPQAKYIPPAGTYPAPNSPPVAPVLPQGTPLLPPQKTRKVGIITTALCLICTGILLALRVFFPNINYLFIARLTPLILVLLGIEMIVASLRYTDEKLRYSFASIFLSLFLIGGSMAAALIPEYFYHSYESSRIATRISAELEQTSAQALQNVNGITYTSVEWYVNMQDSNFTTSATAKDLKPENYVQVRVRMQNEFDSKEDFAAACKTTADILSPLVPHLNYASFYNYNERSSHNQYAGDMRYSIWLENTLQLANSADELAKQVSVEYWLPHLKSYVSEWEYNDRIENPENYAEYIDGTPYDYYDETPEDITPQDEDDFITANYAA